MNQSDASLHFNRGNLYAFTKDYDSAIRDYSEAIRINPGDASSFNNRGNVYVDKGEYDKALKDYTEAIRLDPGNAEAYYNRGHVYYNRGSFKEAAADWRKSIGITPRYEYARICLLLALRKVSKEDYGKELGTFRNYVEGEKSDAWVRTISRYYLGFLKEGQVISEAKKGKDRGKINERLCEAYYYLGEERLWNNDRKGALAFFQKSVETGVSGLNEYVGAQGMIALMKAGKL